MTTTENIRKELQALADAKYQEFHSSLLPGANNILGVRIPQLRIMAKEIIKKQDIIKMFLVDILGVNEKDAKKKQNP